MRTIEVKSKLYCEGCPLEKLSIVGASAVCDNSVICERLFNWLQDADTRTMENRMKKLEQIVRQLK